MGIWSGISGKHRGSSHTVEKVKIHLQQKNWSCHLKSLPLQSPPLPPLTFTHCLGEKKKKKEYVGHAPSSPKWGQDRKWFNVFPYSHAKTAVMLSSATRLGGFNAAASWESRRGVSAAPPPPLQSAAREPITLAPRRTLRSPSVNKEAAALLALGSLLCGYLSQLNLYGSCNS